MPIETHRAPVLDFGTHPIRCMHDLVESKPRQLGRAHRAFEPACERNLRRRMFDSMTSSSHVEGGERSWYRLPYVVCIVACVVSLGGFTVAGCSSTDTPSEDERSSAFTESHRQWVRAFDRELGAVLSREARLRARSTAIVDGLQARDEDDASLRLDLAHRSLLESHYARHDYADRWFEIESKGYALSASGRELIELLERGVRTHGLWPDDLHLFEIREQLRTRTSRTERPPLKIRLELTDRERTALLKRLDDREGPENREEAFRQLADLAANPEGATPRLARAIAESTSEIRSEARKASRLELLLSDALAEYAIEMRYGNTAWHEPRSWRATLRFGDHGPLRSVHLSGEEKKAPTAAERMQRAIETARTRALTAELLVDVWRGEASIETLLEGIHPPYRQYERLTEAFRRYRTVVERGGWPELDPVLMQLGVGSSHPAIRDLKIRLQLEGYFPERDDPSEIFTPELAEALGAYRQTHQLWGTDRITGSTMRSLNVSAERRWHQLRLTLERWRESRIGADRHYVHVNIPDYHASVWRDGERKMRFRVVVGSTEQPEDDEDETRENKESEPSEDEEDEGEEDEEDDGPKYPRATPRFSDTLQYVVLNPYWNVPHGIWQNEIKPKKKENPKYYEKHGYEVVEEANGHRFLRQKPGPKNALGKVKFLFPNEYSVYMHDTNEPYLFEKPVRAYSHGCIRIAKPMEFLDYLLDLDGRWTGERRKELLKKWFGQKKERWLRLREALPVHIEYYVVRIDGQGRAHFGADIYDIDEPRLKRIDVRLDSLPDGRDLPELSYDERLQNALDGDFSVPPSL